MRLFHVSEEPEIQVFEPRLPSRQDLDPHRGLVWALEESCLPNFLTPRNCPRVAYHVGPETTQEDKRRFFTSAGVAHGVVIEHSWFQAMSETVLYLYEFAPKDFTLQDAAAGYYVATNTQVPIGCQRIENLFAEQIRRNVEVRITRNLWKIAEEVKTSTLLWSLCRMRYAQPAEETLTN